MSQAAGSNRLTRPVDDDYDHVLGSSTAEITLVEYGSYDCPHCRAANEPIAQVRDHLGTRLRYVFRHRPVANSEIARAAAELVECADDHETFWDAHVKLMTRSEHLLDDDLQSVARDLGIRPDDDEDRRERARLRVADDMETARESGVRYTPTFFINGRRYDGPWDESSLTDAMLNSLGHRVRSAALDFASWAPSTGLLLVLVIALAVALTN